MKKIFTKKIILLGMLLALSIIILPFSNSTSAQEPTADGYQYYVGGWEIIPKECIDPKTEDSKGVLMRCDANSFIQLFVNFANIMLKLSPPLVVMVFMYGGIKFISAKGKQETIQAGKKILGSAALGMAIITFLGWTLTFFIVQALTGIGNEKLLRTTLNPAGQDWWNPSAVAPDPSDSNNSPDLQCCVIAQVDGQDPIGVGCAMKTESDCVALGGNRDSDFTTTCAGQSQCENINFHYDCCVSPDFNGNDNYDDCIEVGDNIETCFNHTGYKAIGSCPNAMVCD